MKKFQRMKQQATEALGRLVMGVGWYEAAGH